jgi:hypothetical protein
VFFARENFCQPKVAAVAEVAEVAEVADAWRTELKSVGLALTLMKRAMAKSYFERIISESDLFSVLVRSEVAEVAEVTDVWTTERTFRSRILHAKCLLREQIEIQIHLERTALLGAVLPVFPCSKRFRA